MRRRCVRFAFFLALVAAAPALRAIDPPKQPNINPSKERPKNDRPSSAEPVRPQPQQKDSPDDRIERRNSRMKERNREIDQILNKQKR